MDILTRIGSWLHGRRTPVADWHGHRLAGPAGTDGELPVAPEPPFGCGWFDSSLDLKRGLAVIEHEGIDFGLALEAMLAPELGLLQ